MVRKNKMMNKELLEFLTLNVDIPLGESTKVRRKERNKKASYYVTYRYSYYISWFILDGEAGAWSKWYEREETGMRILKSRPSKLFEVVKKLAESDGTLSTHPYIRKKFKKLINWSFTRDDKFKKTVDIKAVRMKNCNVLQYGYMPKIDDISFKTTEFKCVYQCFEDRYSKSRRPKYAKDLYKWCNELYQQQNAHIHNNPDLDMSEGVDVYMLEYACQKMDITFMAFDLHNKMFYKYKSKNCNHPAWVIYCVDEHMYMVTDDKILKSIIAKHADTKHSSQMFVKESKKEELPFHKWCGWKALETIEPCYIIVEDANLNDYFKDFVKMKNYVPKVQMRGKTCIQQIQYKRSDGTSVYIQADANYCTPWVTWNDVKELCEKLDIPFVNQGIGSLIKAYYDKFTKPKREELDKSKLKMSYTKCVKCGSCENIQIDHIKPLANGGTNAESNLQALCKKCHYSKSKEEKEEGYVYVAPLASSFNTQVRDIFESDLMKKWAFNEKLSGSNPKYGYDLHKCRKNNMYYSKYEWPIFTVMDSVLPFDGVVKCGFYYVESKVNFPLRGNGWYSQPIVEYCLKEGIIKSMAIKYQIIPSITLKPDYFRSFIDNVYKTFGKMSKLAINSFIGCFYRLDSDLVQARFCKSFVDACYLFANNANFASFNNEFGLYQVFYETKVKYEETEAPLYLQILDLEAIEAHKLSVIVGKAAWVKTDCIYSPNNVDLSKYEWAPGVPKYKKPEKVVDFCDTESMPRYVRDEEFVLIKEEWNVIHDMDDFRELSKKAIECGSCNIDGRAGCGKSYLINEITRQLDNNFKCLAPTNKAARHIDGSTIHKFCGVGGKRLNLKYLENYKYIIVDEISMVPEMFYKLFIAIKNLRPDMNFIIVGDFEQLLPVNDRVGNCDYKNSRALFELCKGNRIELTKCRRADDTLFNMCIDVDNIDKADFDKKHCRLSLAFTNIKRKYINDIWMDREAKDNKFIFVPKHPFDDNSQDMKICEGTPIIARKNELAKDILNNETFTIKNIKKNVFILDNDIEITKDEFAKLFYPAYCITTHKSQGQTFNEAYTIYEWDRFDKRLKYVALSRSTNKNHINII